MKLVVVLDFDHISLYFVLLRVNNVFHVNEGIFMSVLFWHGETGSDGLNYTKFTSRIFLSV